MISTKRLFLTFLIITFIVGCQTGIDETTINELVPTPQVVVKTDLRGVISDEHNQPIEGAEVKAGSDILFTDQWGYFSFDEVKLDSEGALITIKKEGYFKGSRYFKPNLKDNFVQVKLIEQRVAGSFNAVNGGFIDLNDGAQIIFPADIFQKANGDNFVGTVYVNAYWLDPTLPDVGELMPTNLIGENLAQERVVLASLGMMVVELTSNTGEVLQIKEGGQAELSFPIPTELLATAPASLPLWSFTEDRKIWVQEGQAALEGNYYKAKVNHFSWWNCDWPYPALDLTGKIVAEGQGLADVKIRVTLTDRPWSSTEVFTNVDGDFTTEIPASTLLHLEVLNACNEVVYSSEIGPYVSALDYGEISIDNAAQQFVEIQGQIVDCQQMPVNNGYAIIYFDDRYKIVEMLPNGLLMASIILCDTTSEIRMMAFDMDRSLQSFEMIFDVSRAINFGEIMVCQGIEEYFNFIIDGVNYSNYGPFILQTYEDTGVIIQPYPYYTTVEFDQNTLGNEILGSFNFLSYGVGYHFNTLYTRNVNFEFIDTTITGFGSVNNKFNTCTIHQFGTTVGDVVNLEFVGEWTNLDGELKYISGNLNIKTTP